MAVVEKRGSSWRVLIRKKGQKPISKTFKLKALADRFAKETEVAIQAGTYLEKDYTTIAENVEKYIAEMSRIGTPLKYNKRTCLRRIAREIGDWQIDSFTVQKIIDWQIGRQVAPSTRLVDVINLRTCLEAGRDLWQARPNLDAYNKASDIMFDRGIINTPNHRDQRVTEEELQRLIDAYPLAKMPWADILRFQVVSAFRIGETCRLRWADVNDLDRTVIIRERKHPRKKIDEVVPLLGEAWDIVQRQPRGGEYIFPYISGTVSTAFCEASERADLGHLHLHDLRHEGISRLFEQGYGIMEVSLVSGHKDLRSLKRYTNLRAKDLHKGPIAYRAPHLSLVANAA